MGAAASARRIAIHVQALDPLSRAGLIAELSHRPEVTFSEVDDAEGVVPSCSLTSPMRTRYAQCVQSASVLAVVLVLVLARLDERGLLDADEAGVSCVLRREEASADCVVEAVRAAADGGAAMSPELLGRLLDPWRQPANPSSHHLTKSNLLQYHDLPPTVLAWSGFIMTLLEAQVPTKPTNPGSSTRAHVIARPFHPSVVVSEEGTCAHPSAASAPPTTPATRVASATGTTATTSAPLDMRGLVKCRHRRQRPIPASRLLQPRILVSRPSRVNSTATPRAQTAPRRTQATTATRRPDTPTNTLALLVTSGATPHRARRQQPVPRRSRRSSNTVTPRAPLAPHQIRATTATARLVTPTITFARTVTSGMTPHRQRQRPQGARPQARKTPRECAQPFISRRVAR